ncbi:hypothetical protein ES706_06790 [subsurface metagenome]
MCSKYHQAVIMSKCAAGNGASVIVPLNISRPKELFASLRAASDISTP